MGPVVNHLEVLLVPIVLGGFDARRNDDFFRVFFFNCLYFRLLSNLGIYSWWFGYVLLYLVTFSACLLWIANNTVTGLALDRLQVRNG